MFSWLIHLIAGLTGKIAHDQRGLGSRPLQPEELIAGVADRHTDWAVAGGGHLGPAGGVRKVIDKTLVFCAPARTGRYAGK
jgi:hypothetical protein